MPVFLDSFAGSLQQHITLPEQVCNHFGLCGLGEAAREMCGRVRRACAAVAISLWSMFRVPFDWLLLFLWFFWDDIAALNARPHLPDGLPVLLGGLVKILK